MRMHQACEIPVTILGGYLGAGKTTLLNAVLTETHGYRIAIIVNDFGPISIDEKLIAAKEEDIITLANGCACCSISGDLGTALDRLAAHDAKPDHILVETSGVADPRQVAKLSQAPGLNLHATIVVADANSVKSQSKDKFVGRLVQRQLSGADMIILNKVDLLEPDQLGDLSLWLESLAPNIPRFPTSFGRVPASLLFDTEASEAIAAGDADEFSVAHPHFHSFHWSTDRPVDLGNLQRCISEFPESVVRIKGIVGSVSNCDDRYAIHRVAGRTNLSALPSRIGERKTDIVFLSVGRPLEVEAAEIALQACVDRKSPNP